MTSGRPSLFSAVGCVLWHDHDILLLKRNPSKSYPNHWGLPGGKVEAGETDVRAAIRELYEETGILLSAEQLDLFATYPVETRDMTFDYSVFLHSVSSLHAVRLDAATHTAFGWFSMDAMCRMTLVPQLMEMLSEVAATLSPPGQLNLFAFPSLGPRSDVKRIEQAVSASVGALDMLRPLGPIGPWYVAIGPPGAGKSTLLRGICDLQPQRIHCRDDTILKAGSRLNYYLKEAFERNNIAAFFHFQIEVLPLRWWQTLNAPAGAVIDETIYSTLAYSRALLRLKWITEVEYQTFFRHYLSYKELLRSPSTVFYVRCDIETLKRRIRRRGRMLEVFYDQPYLEMLVHCFEEVAQELATSVSVQRIDSTRMTPKELVIRYAPTA